MYWVIHWSNRYGKPVRFFTGWSSLPLIKCRRCLSGLLACKMPDLCDLFFQSLELAPLPSRPEAFPDFIFPMAVSTSSFEKGQNPPPSPPYAFRPASLAAPGKSALIISLYCPSSSTYGVHLVLKLLNAYPSPHRYSSSLSHNLFQNPPFLPQFSFTPF